MQLTESIWIHVLYYVYDGESMGRKRPGRRGRRSYGYCLRSPASMLHLTRPVLLRLGRLVRPREGLSRRKVLNTRRPYFQAGRVFPGTIRFQPTSCREGHVRGTDSLYDHTTRWLITRAFAGQRVSQRRIGHLLLGCGPGTPPLKCQ